MNNLFTDISAPASLESLKVSRLKRAAKSLVKATTQLYNLTAQTATAWLVYEFLKHGASLSVATLKHGVELTLKTLLQ